MLTNFVDAAARNFCRGWDGVFGAFPSACLNDAGRPMLFLALVVLFVVGVLLVVGWKRFHRRRA